MNPTSPEREIFVQNAVKWSSNNFMSGHPDLHQKLAKIYWREKNFTLAKFHFLYSRDSYGCALMLIELHNNHGYSNEVELFIAQVVLQLLCLKKKSIASEIFEIYVSQHPKIDGGPPYVHPVLNFLSCLLNTIESRNYGLFTTICKQYTTCLTKDPCIIQYLDKVGHIFFKSKPSQGNHEGLLNSFLNSFFDGFSSDDTTSYQVNNTLLAQVAELD
ncbi:Golgi to ER traffic protein 4 homolog [Copidosoma floridanum]|uniref:Golgi to ER traffic protein 4 homolog n=1 Tax=Copidosoma floridanum TaxID=29053 RepID=UPI0006C999D6|nr:Golgi to ER traffic protein 4 homolog [Copidosoma floridanum]